jgi:hypothetical protein
MSEAAETRNSDTTEYTGAPSGKFRFKSSQKSSSRRVSYDRETRDRQSKHRRSASPESLRSRHRSGRSRRSPVTDDPSAYDDSYQPNARTSQYLDPEDAFRESLFDALADDEGAAYWEGVYGQPIHTYPKTKTGEKGELEEMTDEEYAAYVRNRMWEKSHQHILEERARREKVRERQRQDESRQHQEESDRKRFDAIIDQALRSGDKRRKERVWKDAWEKYTTKWSKFLDSASNGSLSGSQHTSTLIPWPVETGRRRDISKDAVEQFFHHNPEESLAAIVKTERVRWHPDKMQQRFRGTELDPDILQSITSVFQIIDDIWVKLKKTN